MNGLFHIPPGVNNFVFSVNNKRSVMFTLYFNVEGYTLNNLISLLVSIFFKVIEVAFLLSNIHSKFKIPNLSQALSKLRVIAVSH